MGVTAIGRSPGYWMQDRILKKKTVLRTKILQTLIVQQHCCENFVEFGCQLVVQCDPLLR